MKQQDPSLLPPSQPDPDVPFAGRRLPKGHPKLKRGPNRGRGYRYELTPPDQFPDGETVEWNGMTIPRLQQIRNDREKYDRIGSHWSADVQLFCGYLSIVAGWSQSDIARALGVASDMIYKWSKKGRWEERRERRLNLLFEEFVRLGITPKFLEKLERLCGEIIDTSLMLTQKIKEICGPDKEVTAEEVGRLADALEALQEPLSMYAGPARSKFTKKLAHYPGLLKADKVPNLETPEPDPKLLLAPATGTPSESAPTAQE